MKFFGPFIPAVFLLIFVGFLPAQIQAYSGEEMLRKTDSFVTSYEIFADEFVPILDEGIRTVFSEYEKLGSTSLQEAQKTVSLARYIFSNTGIVFPRDLGSTFSSKLSTLASDIKKVSASRLRVAKAVIVTRTYKATLHPESFLAPFQKIIQVSSNNVAAVINSVSAQTLWGTSSAGNQVTSFNDSTAQVAASFPRKIFNVVVGGARAYGAFADTFTTSLDEGIQTVFASYGELGLSVADTAQSSVKIVAQATAPLYVATIDTAKSFLPLSGVAPVVTSPSEIAAVYPVPPQAPQASSTGSSSAPLPSQNPSVPTRTVVERIKEFVGLTKDDVLALVNAAIDARPERTVAVTSGVSNSFSNTISSLTNGGLTLSNTPLVNPNISGGTITGATFASSTFSGDITASAFYGDGSHLTGIASFSTSTTRGAFSSSILALNYASTTGDFSLAAGYEIPLSASTTEWANKVSSQWAANGSNISFASGNVGIGTTSPQALLHLSVSDGQGEGIMFTDAAASAGNKQMRIQFHPTPGGTSPAGIIFQKVNDDNSWGADLLTIRNNGNVGIGKNTPAAKLDVAGQGYFNSNIVARSGALVFPDGTEFIGGYDGNADRAFFFSGTISGGSVVARKPMFFDGLTQTFTAGASGNSALFIDSSGNIGIGTTTPQSPLQVYGASGSNAGIIQITPGTGSITDYGYLAVNNRARFGYDVTGVKIDDKGASGATGNKNFEINLGNASRLFISSSGNVGIGTTSPSAKLDIYGTAGASDIFAISSSTNSRLFTVTGAGYVGVGTSIPGSKFTVNGGDNKDTGPILNLSGNATNQFESGRVRFTETTIAASPYYQGAYFHYDGSSNIFNIGVHQNATNLTSDDVNAISIPRSTGYVGIGTTTPSSLLTVAGNGYINGLNVGAGLNSNTRSIYSMNPTSSSFNEWAFRNDAGLAGFYMNGSTRSSSSETANSFNFYNDVGMVKYRANGDHIFLTGAYPGVEQMRITSAGNVGIGTNNPGTKLEVNGNISQPYDNVYYSIGNDKEIGIVKQFGAGGRFAYGYGNHGVGNAIFTISRSSGQTIDPLTNTFTDVFVINNAGNVGIGTTTPQYALTVASTTVTSRLGVGITSIPAPVLFGVGPNLINDSNLPVQFSSNTGINYIGLNAQGSGYGALIGYTESEFGGGLVLRTVGSKDIHFLTDNTLESLTVKASTGYVGIGTTNPSSKLSLGNQYPDYRNRIALYEDTSSNNFRGIGMIHPDSTFGVGIWAKLGAIPPTDFNADFVVRDGGNVGIGTSSPADYGLGVAKLTISTSGANSPSVLVANTNNVGISTFTSVNSAGVFGQVLKAGSSYSGYKSFAANDYGIYNGTTGNMSFLNDNASGNINFTTGGASASQMILLSNGNVGIGTTTPWAKLTVSGQGAFDTFATASTTATSTIAGGLDVGNGSLRYDWASGVTSVNNLQMGALNFDTDAGIVSWTDMPVTASSSLGTIESYTAQLGGTSVLTIYGQSTGIGGVQNIGVGIGTTTPSQALVASGTIQSTALLGGATTLSVDANGNIIRTPSDERLKTNIIPLVGALDKVLALQGVSYTWKDISRFGSSTEIGLIAQQVEQVVPEVVKSGGEYKSLNYGNLVALVIEAIKDLKKQLDEVKTQLANAGSAVSNFVELTVEKFTVGSSAKPAGITLYDEVTGVPYCLKIRNGQTVTISGACDSTSVSTGTTTTTVITDGGNDTSTTTATTTTQTVTSTSIETVASSTPTTVASSTTNGSQDVSTTTTDQ